MKQTKKIFFFLLLAGALATISDNQSMATEETNDFKEKVRQYFSDLKLTNQQGEEVSFFSDVIEDRIVLINGFYTHCNSGCSMQMTILSKLQTMLMTNFENKLGKELFIVSITLDPERDNLEKIKSYADRYSKGPGWLFLTGNTENINWVNYRLGQYAKVVERHKNFYLLGNLRTGQWIRIQSNADAEQLMQLFQQQASGT
ncbi:MAG: SCO family protein [Deltaproteobacteria bacterium]|jgi:protein SCO1/2|nr:SCO family protein [Deltaproteobacteria bacterium]